MIGLIKALLGVATVGGGIVLPVAMSQSGTEANAYNPVTHAKETARALGETTNRLVGSLLDTKREEERKNRENSNFSAVFGDLNSKDCQLIKNPAGSQNGFHNIYVCKAKKDKGNNSIPTSFYYLGARDSVKEMSRDAMKEIETINYEDNGQIMLKLKNSNEKISISVMAGEGGWSYFKNVDLSKKCQIETKMLGGDDLRCELTDTNGKTFFYNFSIF